MFLFLQDHCQRPARRRLRRQVAQHQPRRQVGHQYRELRRQESLRERLRPLPGSGVCVLARLKKWVLFVAFKLMNMLVIWP